MPYNWAISRRAGEQTLPKGTHVFLASISRVPRRKLASARLPVTPTIALALLAELILVETRSSQLLAHLLTGLPLTAHLTIAPTITLTLLAQAILVFAGEPQLFALASASPAPTIIYADAAGSDLKCLSRDRGGYNKG